MASKIDIIFEIEEKSYKLPVLPSELSINSPTANESAETIALGEITIMKKRGLRSFSIDSFFPAKRGLPFCKTNDVFKPPMYYVSAFTKAQENQTAARITVTNSGLKAFWCTIENFVYTKSQTDDVNYSLEIKEFRPYGKTSKQMEATGSLFEVRGDKAVLGAAVGQIRPPGEFAVGDKVLVTGQYFSTCDGIPFPIEAPMNFLQNPYSAVGASLWKSRKDLLYNEPLNKRRCIICDIAKEKTKYYDWPFAGEVDLGGVGFYQNSVPYQVADLSTRNTIGWVSKEQLVRL